MGCIPGRKNKDLRFVPFVAGCIGTMAAVWCLSASAGFISDLYYMLAEGRRILSGGVQHFNMFAWDTSHGIVLQNWATCAVLAWLEQALGLPGIYLFYGAAIAGTMAFVYKILRKRTRSRVISGLLAMASIVIYLATMLRDMRPAGLTLLLVMLSAHCFERYGETGKPAYLVLQPVLMLVEINFHAAMWPMHFCVLAAYAVPPLHRSICDDTRAVRPSAAIACGLSMAAAMFMNPYGLGAVLYPFRCMAVFRAIDVPEQGPLKIISSTGIIVILCVAALVWLAQRKKLGSSELYLCAGFLALAVLKQHGCMFLPFVYAMLAGTAAGSRAGLIDGAIPEKDARVLGISMRGICAALFCLLAFIFPPIAHQDAAALAGYVLGNSDGGQNIVGCVEISSFLEYCGGRGLFFDGRVEYLGGGINGCHDMTDEKIFLSNGDMSDRLASKYSDMDDYLEQNHVRFVIDYRTGHEFPFLFGWISKSGQWAENETAGTPDFMVWEYIGQ